MMDVLLQSIASIVLLLNKVYLRKKKSFGWILGIIGILVLSIPIYNKQLWINLGYHVGFGTLMTYGYLLAVIPKEMISLVWKSIFKILIIAGTLILCVYLYIQTQESPNFNNWQLCSAISGLIGSLCLTFNARNLNTAGWMFYITSHCIGTYVMFQKDLYVISFFQTVSIIIALHAIKDLQRPPPEVLK